MFRLVDTYNVIGEGVLRLRFCLGNWGEDCLRAVKRRTDDCSVGK